VRIEILDEAQQDLLEGFHFYEKVTTGLGSYFLDCLFSDIDSLIIYAGIHPIVWGYHRSLSKRFLLRSPDGCGPHPCGTGLPEKPNLD